MSEEKKIALIYIFIADNENVDIGGLDKAVRRVKMDGLEWGYSDKIQEGVSLPSLQIACKIDKLKLPNGIPENAFDRLKQDGLIYRIDIKSKSV
uniref:Translation elongation factor EF1B beta/delta subunit guanine nucleotide exchange domain-containing protein n=1 Tax=Panagrolaimus davidi TaxID=227884 RepID=A0A914PZ61_9BILA